MPVKMEYMPAPKIADTNDVIDREEQFRESAQIFFDSLKLKILPRRDDEEMLRTQKDIDIATKQINEEKKEAKMLKSVQRKTKNNGSKKKDSTGENKVVMDNFVGNGDFKKFTERLDARNIKKRGGKNFSRQKSRNVISKSPGVFEKRRSSGFKPAYNKNRGFSSTYGNKKSKNRPGKARRSEIRQKFIKK